MKSLILSAFFLIFSASGALASGSEDELFIKHFNHQSRVASHGYDLVSYFSGSPKAGSPSIQVRHKGLVFRFSSRENANSFSRNPSKFLPAYGGWCATAMGMMNTKLDVDPASYLIQGGKLYLFSTSMGPAKDQWIQNQPNITVDADKNWAAISSH